MPGFRFRDESPVALKFKIRPDGDFAEVLQTFNDVKYPPTGIADEQITFVIMELISNSLRAHRERKRNEPVLTELSARGGRLRVVIRDRGGGFDPGRLPCGLDEDPHAVNVMSEKFKSYRESHGNARFGMGLVATRKVFPVFRLAFVDDESNEHPWPSERIVGTMITLEAPIAGERCDDGR